MESIAKEETMYAYFSRLGGMVGAAEYMSIKLAHDYRIATPRRIAWAAQHEMRGYGGQLVAEAAIGLPLRCDGASHASIHAVLSHK